MLRGPEHKKLTYEKVCKYCGRTFMAKMIHTEYCYDELCIRKRKRDQSKNSNKKYNKTSSNRYAKICKNCGSKFTSKMPNTLYCYNKECVRQRMEKSKKAFTAKQKAAKLLVLLVLVFCSVYAPGKYYDQHNQYIGKQTIEGRCYDKHNAYVGKVTKDGKRYDKNGRYLGRYRK